MASKEIKRPQTTSPRMLTTNQVRPASESDYVKFVKNKNKLKGGGNIDIDDEYLNKFSFNELVQMRVQKHFLALFKTNKWK